MLRLSQLGGFGVSVRPPAVLIDRTTGTNISGPVVGVQPISNPDAAFDGTSSQAFLSGLYAQNEVGQGVYAGKTTAVPTAVESVTVFGGNDQGYFHSFNSAVTMTLYGKTGSAPSSSTNGTALGSINFTDTSNESAGRTINSSDINTYWDHIWVRVAQNGTSNNCLAGIAEIQITGWKIALAPPTLESFGNNFAGGTNQSSMTWTNYGIGTATSDRLVIVAVGMSSTNGGANLGISTISIGGTNGTMHVNDASVHGPTAIASRVVSSGTTATIVATLASSNGSNWHVYVWTLKNYVSATPTGTGNAEGTASNASTLNASCTVAEPGVLVGIACKLSHQVSSFSPTTTSQIVATNSQSSGFEYLSGDGSVSETVTFAASGPRGSMALAAWR